MFQPECAPRLTQVMPCWAASRERRAARRLAAERGIPLVAGTVGNPDADWIDTRFAWLRQREISDTGVVLVRPDRFIGFRAAGAAKDPYAVLAEALGRVLATGAATPSAVPPLP
ncbi:hypothetical protein G3I42_34395 [Streptomyces sp. SID11385]|nr:hypothetical protein [Streptomyces sp. SID11385]